MADNEIGFDRLLPRHTLSTPLKIRWNTGPRRRALRRPAGKGAEGVIRDLSLNGALIEVKRSRAKLGDQVPIRLGNRSGVVEVHHVTPANSDHGVLFGVSFVETTELQDQFEIVIQHLRRGETRREARTQAT